MTCYRLLKMCKCCHAPTLHTNGHLWWNGHSFWLKTVSRKRADMSFKQDVDRIWIIHQEAWSWRVEMSESVCFYVSLFLYNLIFLYRIVCHSQSVFSFILLFLWNSAWRGPVDLVSILKCVFVRCVWCNNTWITIQSTFKWQMIIFL